MWPPFRSILPVAPIWKAIYAVIQVGTVQAEEYISNIPMWYKDTVVLCQQVFRSHIVLTGGWVSKCFMSLHYNWMCCRILFLYQPDSTISHLTCSVKILYRWLDQPASRLQITECGVPDCDGGLNLGREVICNLSVINLHSGQCFVVQ